MRTASASRSEPATQAGEHRTVLVWDAPVRVVHALLIACVLGAWLTGDSERWRLLHVTCGLTVAGLVAFRLAWGVLGTRHARFAAFVRKPSAARRYLAALFGARPEHHVGHNPAGGLAIVAMLVLLAATAATGWGAEQGIEVLEELHEGVVNTLLALVGVHVAAVVVSSALHGENLVAAMVTGRKRGRPADGIRRPWRGVAALVVAAVLGFWAWQWQAAPDPDAPRAERSAHRHGHGPARDQHAAH